MALRLTRLSPELVKRCVDHCNAAMQDFADKKHPQVLAVSTHGAESNLPLWVKSKFAECIFALEMNLDPIVAVRWKSGPDAGADVMVGQQRIDVKHCEMNYKLLCWPVGKNHIYDSKNFDVLALTKVDVYTCSGVTVGWVTKERFRTGMVRCSQWPCRSQVDKRNPLHAAAKA